MHMRTYTHMYKHTSPHIMHKHTHHHTQTHTHTTHITTYNAQTQSTHENAVASPKHLWLSCILTLPAQPDEHCSRKHRERRCSDGCITDSGGAVVTTDCHWIS